MVNQRDVAKRAGVSVATISAVINKNKFVSENLKEKVLKAIEELNYEPNAIARSLRVSKTFTIGVIIPNIKSAPFAYLVRAIEDVARSNGYNIILNSSEEDEKIERSVITNLREKRVDGMIVAPCKKTNIQLFEVYKKRMPIVFIDRDIEELNIDYIGSDNFDATFNTVNYLADLGHRNIAIISLPKDITTGKERLDGYLKALEKRKLDINFELIKEGNFTKGEGYKKTLEILESKNKFDSIIVCNHLMTLGCMKAFNENNLSIPDDISVIGFDDFPWIEFLNPPLTVISQKMDIIGEGAVKLIIKRIRQYKTNKKSLKPKKIIINAELIIRNSCKERN